MLNIYLHFCHRNFLGESLLIRVLETLTKIKVVEKQSNADLIIAGPRGFFYNKQPCLLHHVPKLRNYILSQSEPLQARKGQTTLFYSPEPPPAGFYKSSNCMYGISSEILTDNTSYFRLPLWMDSIDWTDYGIRGSATDRTGVKVKPSSLADERNPFLVLNKSLKLAIITSHLIGFRSDVVNRLDKAIPIHGYGPFYNQNIKHHNESGFLKSDVLAQYAFNLCPENTLYPGYVTEKILEAYICNTIPVTVADSAACSLDFNTSSIINLYENYVNMTDYLMSILHDKHQLLAIASQPLFMKPPSLDPFIKFLTTSLSIS